MAKEPAIGVPNGLQAPRSAKGDCNEHMAPLFFWLVPHEYQPESQQDLYSDRAGPRKSFYYHAWASTATRHMGPRRSYIWSIPADATHIEGDLDKQISIMGLLGNISPNSSMHSEDS